MKSRRWTRILTGILGWVIGVAASFAAITLLFLAVFILFFDYPDYLRKWIEGEATRVLGAPVSIDSISVDLPNYSFLIAGVRVEARTEGPAPLEIESVRGQLNLTGVFDRELHLALLEVSGLKFRVQDYGGGRIEVPGRLRPPAGPANSGAGGMALLADRIRIEDAFFIYNNTNIPWRLEAEELAANLEREGSSRFRGTVEFERGSVQVKGRQPIEAAVDARFRLSGRELELEELNARGSFYELSSKGSITLGTEPQADLTIEVESEVGPAATHLLGLTLLSSGRGNRGEFSKAISSWGGAGTSCEVSPGSRRHDWPECLSEISRGTYFGIAMSSSCNPPRGAWLAGRRRSISDNRLRPLQGPPSST